MVMWTAHSDIFDIDPQVAASDAGADLRRQLGDQLMQIFPRQLKARRFTIG